jgi:hypothetical protein
MKRVKPVVVPYTDEDKHAEALAAALLLVGTVCDKAKEEAQQARHSDEMQRARDHIHTMPRFTRDVLGVVIRED